MGLDRDIFRDTGRRALPAGAIIANLFQSDQIGVRAYIRIALQATSPLGVAGSGVKPLALAKTGVARTAAAKK